MVDKISEQAKLLTSTKEELGKSREECIQTTQKYEATKGKLKKVLSKTTLEMDEKQQLIDILKSTVVKLSHQGQTLLQVANQATDDVSKLHAKIDRKENMEKTNGELSNEFRIMCQKQFTEFHDMLAEENKWIMQDFQSFYGILSKLDCGLSEHEQTSADLHSKLGKIESSMNEFLTHLQKEASNGRQSVNDLSDNMHSQKEKLDLEQQTFWAETLPPLLNKLYVKNEEWEDWVLNICKEIEQKTNHLESVLEGQRVKQWNLLSTLKSSLDSLCSKFDATVASLKEEKQSRMKSKIKFSQLLKELIAVETEMDQNELREEDTFSTVENCNLELKSLKEPLNVFETEINSTGDNILEFSGIPAIIKLDEAQAIKESYLKSNKTISLKVAEFSEHLKMKQNKIYEELKISLEGHDMLLENIQNDGAKIKTIITSASDEINNDIRCLGECTETLKSTISYSRNTVIEAEKRNILAESRLKEEICKLDLANEKFILEDLVKDIPTGTTPQRKTYDYPTVLVAPYPPELVLQRYRSQIAVDTAAAINLSLDTSFNESEESKYTSTEDISSAVSSHNTSFASDDYDSGGETGSSAVFDTSAKGSRNKENRKEGKNSSHLPKRLPKFTKFVKPYPITGRKPLVSINPDTNTPS